MLKMNYWPHAPWYLHKYLKCFHIRGFETSWLERVRVDKLQEIGLDLRSYLSHDEEQFNFEDMNRLRKPGRSEVIEIRSLGKR